MIGKRRWPASLVYKFADRLVADLEPRCEKVCIAGSLRRGIALVGDIEILYIPRSGQVRGSGELFPRSGSLADEIIQQWVTKGVLRKRSNPTGITTWGTENEYALRSASGIPVELFPTTAERWYVALVVRTGSDQLVTKLMARAPLRGMQLHSDGLLEVNATGEQMTPHSEREVFKSLGVPYRAPTAR